MYRSDIQYHLSNVILSPKCGLLSRLLPQAQIWTASRVKHYDILDLAEIDEEEIFLIGNFQWEVICC